MNSNININNINKPFAIIVKQMTLFNRFIQKISKEINTEESSLLLTAQLFSGDIGISHIVKVIINASLTSEINSIIMHKFNFSLSYCEVPVHCNVLFKIKIRVFNKKENKYKFKTISWVNFRLFDHLKRLKTGKYIIINFFLLRLT
jgi:hypothetical protein